MIVRIALLVTTLIAALAGNVSAAAAPEKWAMWDEVDATSTAVIDHSNWQKVLDAYLRPSPDNINRFAYKEVQGEGAQSLANYLEQMAAIDPRQYNAAEQQAYWINVYNALTVDQVLQYPKKKSILRMSKKFFAIGPWDDSIFEVAGQELTLNDIEHRILRPIFQDHRVHYAVNCASIGCPNLGEKVFNGAELEAQLAEQERSYVNHPRGVTFNKKGRLVLSQIYEWYGSDFAPSEAELVAYLAEQHQEFGEQLKTYTGKVSYAYDWDLNTAK